MLQNTAKYFVWRKNVLILLTILAFQSSLFGQEKQHHLIQFSGLIVSSDTSFPVPNAHIRIKNTRWGTISNAEGFFSIVVRENDTLSVSCVGFRNKLIVIPPGINQPSLTMVIPMYADTITFAETVVYPWPSKDKFRQAFLEIQPEATLEDLAKKNLNPATLMALSAGLPKDGPEQQHIALNNMAKSAGYLGGQTNYAIFPGSNIPVPLSLLNPFAWAELIKAIREGKFKSKD